MATEIERTPAVAPYEPDAELVLGSHTDATITEEISSIVLERFPRKLWWAFAASFALFGVLMVAIAYLLAAGVGIWGVNIPVAWGFAIVNFVWWIGIGHAGTLISAILLL